MEKNFIAILASLACCLLQAQQTRSPLSERYTETGVYSNNFHDAFSGAINQAALAGVQQPTAGVYGERWFMLKQLSHYSAALAFPSRFGGFGIAIHYFGSEDFNSSQLGLGYGKRLGRQVDIGIQFNYNAIRLAGYGSSATVNFEAGTLLHLGNKLHIGLHAYNPLSSNFGKTHTEKLAAVYSTGIGYEISDKVFISATMRKQEDEPANINAALQYNVADHFFVRLGTGTSPAYYFLGLGVQWKTIRIDAISTWQAPLGFTPGIMFLFDLHEHKPVASIDQ